MSAGSDGRSNDDVRRIALSLPDTSEADDNFAFSVLNKGKAKGFAWVWRSESSRRSRGCRIPGVLAVRVADDEEKEELLASDDEKFFTEPHYKGFPAVLVRLAAIDVDELEELITDAWRCQAPKKLLKEFDHGTDPRRAALRIATASTASALPNSAPPVP